MNKVIRRGTAILLALLLTVCLSACGAENAPESTLEATAVYLLKTIPAPEVGSVGGEWTVIGLARSGETVPSDYFEAYYERLSLHVQECAGILNPRKYTEYSRVVLAVTAIGKDPSDVAGYDLLRPLGDFEQVTKQGINGTIFALLALDSGGYAVPENPEAAVQATRQMYVDELLSRELPDGGWTLTGGEPDVDITAMTLQALAKYREQPSVAAAVERGVEVLSALQDADGGYTSWGASNSESVSQMIVALTELGIPVDDSRFVKNGATLEDALLRFAGEDGGFCHVLDGSGGDDLMATEQAFYALASIARRSEGKTSLYDMTDVRS